MPRMAQQGTTTNLRRLAGRRSPSTGGPHIPLESSDYPPVLFRLPEVEAEPTTNAAASPSTSHISSEPAAVAVSKASPTLNIVQQPSPTTAETGHNVFNHVAGAVTGAVAGTVANGVAVAGNLAGSALAANPFGTSNSSGNAQGARPSFASVAASVSSPTTSLEAPASIRPTPVMRPVPEATENDSRSWWEHWSSGIILMLLILALVTAGIMAIRDPGKSRDTQRSIADDSKTNTSSTTTSSTTTSAQTKSDTTATAEKPTPAENKPVLADNQAAQATSPPAASAALSPSLLPEANTNSNEVPKSRVPSFTLGPNSSSFTSANTNPTNSNPVGFVSSTQPSPGAAASQGPASRLATEFANTNNPNATPAISASTQIGRPQADNFEATVPASPNDSSTTNPNLTWPVEPPAANSPAANNPGGTAPLQDQQTSASESSPELKLSQGPTVTAPDFLPPTAPAPAATPVALAPAATANNATTQPAAVVASRPAYLETSLPNEDLESILEMRRQAMPNARVVSNQFYPTAPSTPTATNNPSAIPNSGFANMPTHNNIPSANNVPNYNNMPSQNNFPSNMTGNMAAPTHPSVAPMQQPVSYPTGMNQGAMSFPTSSSNAVPSQSIGTRSWTYAPNTPNTPNTQNTWTLNQPSTTPTASTQNLPSNGGLQMDPNFARQLGYGQTNTTSTNISASGSGWSNTNAPARTPIANNPYGIVNQQPAQNPAFANPASGNSGAPNIAAPPGSMMAPNGFPTGNFR